MQPSGHSCVGGFSRLCTNTKYKYEYFIAVSLTGVWPAYDIGELAIITANHMDN